MRYQGSNKSPLEIAKELVVHGVICGSVRVSENRLEVQVALFEGASGQRLWDKVYERSLTDLFRVQGEIAETIAAEIHLKLTASERRHIRAHRTRSPDVQKVYLRGRYYWNRETPEALQRSFRYLSVACTTDSPTTRRATAPWRIGTCRRDATVSYQWRKESKRRKRQRSELWNSTSGLLKPTLPLVSLRWTNGIFNGRAPSSRPLRA